jgi:hypothetical protein
MTEMPVFLIKPQRVTDAARKRYEAWLKEKPDAEDVETEMTS